MGVCMCTCVCTHTYTFTCMYGCAHTHMERKREYLCSPLLAPLVFDFPYVNRLFFGLSSFSSIVLRARIWEVCFLNPRMLKMFFFCPDS